MKPWRLAIAFIVALVSAATSVGADAPSGGKNAAIPQDLAKAEKLRKMRLDWYRNNTVRAYDRVGNKSPKWDEPARNALESVALKWAEPNSPVTLEQMRVLAEACEKATAAGCDDPLICFLSDSHGFRYIGENLSRERLKRVVDRADALAKSNYPAACKIHGLTVAVHTLALLDGQKSAEGILQRFTAIVPLIRPALESGGSEARAETTQYFETLLDTAQAVGMDFSFCFAILIQPIKKLPAERALELSLTGRLQTRQAWDARGSGFAATVDEKGWKGFKEYLGDAEKSLTQAWQADSENALTAVEMLQIARGMGYDRKKMEMWFRRAMVADPDCFVACRTKLEYLLPRWHGSEEEAREFGLECLSTNNWVGGLPLILVKAHENIAPPPLDREHLKEAQVWDDVQAVYKAMLDKYPNSVSGRMGFALVARKCVGPAEGMRVFYPIREVAWKPSFNSEKEYKSYKAAAEANAKKNDK
jgi:hypothetical protein